MGVLADGQIAVAQHRVAGGVAPLARHFRPFGVIGALFPTRRLLVLRAAGHNAIEHPGTVDISALETFIIYYMKSIAGSCSVLGVQVSFYTERTDTQDRSIFHEQLYRIGHAGGSFGRSNGTIIDTILIRPPVAGRPLHRPIIQESTTAVRRDIIITIVCYLYLFPFFGEGEAVGVLLHHVFLQPCFKLLGRTHGTAPAVVVKRRGSPVAQCVTARGTRVHHQDSVRAVRQVGEINQLQVLVSIRTAASYTGVRSCLVIIFITGVGVCSRIGVFGVVVIDILQVVLHVVGVLVAHGVLLLQRDGPARRCYYGVFFHPLFCSGAAACHLVCLLFRRTDVKNLTVRQRRFGQCLQRHTDHAVGIETGVCLPIVKWLLIAMSHRPREVLSVVGLMGMKLFRLASSRWFVGSAFHVQVPP